MPTAGSSGSPIQGIMRFIITNHMKKYLIPFFGAVLMLMVAFSVDAQTSVNAGAQVGANATICSADAKLCPDGSYVGRTGPKCEFAACPNEGTPPPPPPPPPPGGAGVGTGGAGSGTGNSTSGSTACTKEAKMCPDGSSVGRIGPKCEFAACPGSPGTTGNTDVTVNAGSAVSVKAVEVRGWDPAKKEEFMATVKAHAELKSGQELENFARGILLNDEKASEVTVDDNGVGMKYQIPAKFLGVFNASVRTHTSVDAMGNVTVEYPWYAFLFKKYVSSDEVKADITTALEAEASTSGKTDAAKKGGLLNALHMTLKAGSEAWLTTGN